MFFDGNILASICEELGRVISWRKYTNMLGYLVALCRCPCLGGYTRIIAYRDDSLHSECFDEALRIFIMLMRWDIQHGVFILNISLMSVLHLRLYTECPLNLTRGLTRACKFYYLLENQRALLDLSDRSPCKAQYV